MMSAESSGTSGDGNDRPSHAVTHEGVTHGDNEWGGHCGGCAWVWCGCGGAEGMMRERGREKEKGERLDRLVPAVAVAAVVPAGTFPEQSRGRDQIQLEQPTNIHLLGVSLFNPSNPGGTALVRGDCLVVCTLSGSSEIRETLRIASCRPIPCLATWYAVYTESLTSSSVLLQLRPSSI
jgi:hypothetical protein